MKLRSYQLADVDTIRAAFKAGARMVVYQCPTGGGKTPTSCGIIKSAAGKGKRVYFFVHLQELLRQASKKLTEWDVLHGVIWSKAPKTSDMVQVCSVQTVVRRLSKLDPPDIIIVDECHHSTSSTYTRCFEAWPNALVLGITATPNRPDGTGLRRAGYESLVCGPTVSWLQNNTNPDNGLPFLRKARIFIPPNDLHLEKIHTVGGDYQKDELALELDKSTITGDAVEHYKKLAYGRLAIAFTDSVARARQVARAFREAGIPSESIDGQNTDEEREDILARFSRGEIWVLTSCQLISEGVDVPGASCAILMRPTQSEILHLQQLGRVLRPTADIDFAIILDMVGNIRRHGPPDAERDWGLDGRKKRDVEHELKIRQCGECFAVVELQDKICSICGASLVTPSDGGNDRDGPEEIEGDLVELTDIKLLKEKAKTKEDWIKIGILEKRKHPNIYAETMMRLTRKRA